MLHSRTAPKASRLTDRQWSIPRGWIIAGLAIACWLVVFLVADFITGPGLSRCMAADHSFDVCSYALR